MSASRYADGRAATTQEVRCDFGPDGVTISLTSNQLHWLYRDLLRADDDNGIVSLRRRDDTGERVFLGADDAILLRRASPDLFKPAARGIERPHAVGAIAFSAWALAAVFLVGVPLAAAPIASMLPSPWRGQIANIAWAQVQGQLNYCDDGDQANRVLNTMADRMMIASHVPERDQVSIVIVDASIPNAFAMPDDTIVVTDKLIAMAETPDEIAGVIGHEIAHVELNHVMTGYVRNMGAGTFFDIVFGGGGIGQALAVGLSTNLSGLGYDRDAEAAADRRGFDYLDHAGIDPGGLGRLFDRFARLQHEHNSGLATLLSNHPASTARAAAARARARPGSAPAMTAAEWRIVRSACAGSASPPAAQPQQQSPPPAPSPPSPDKAKHERRAYGLPSRGDAG